MEILIAVLLISLLVAAVYFLFKVEREREDRTAALYKEACERHTQKTEEWIRKICKEVLNENDKGEKN